ncbi:MAG: hypothetical protein NT003_00275, partial [Candidatus Magasanikbacteria bacterium]|nr:hypothetical protein [Candidatus Magasanikbacteria bacterium]
MIDIGFIRTNPEEVKKSAASRNAEDVVDELLAIDSRVRTKQQEVETMRHELKSRSKGKPTEEDRVELQRLSQTIKETEVVLAQDEAERTTLLLKLPNIND